MDIGEKGRADMSKEIIYTNAPGGISESIMNGEILADFLPLPEQLVQESLREAVATAVNRKQKRNLGIRKSLSRKSVRP
jgi:hypothetical protein